MTNLRGLGLDDTEVTDISPVARMTALQDLLLKNVPVTDLSPISGLRNVQHLFLRGTDVEDISPIGSIGSLRELRINGSRVSDLRPVANWISAARSADPEQARSIRFADTPACEDPAIAEAAAIADDRERLEALLAHLSTLPPWPEPLAERSFDTQASESIQAEPAHSPIRTAEHHIAFLLEHAAINAIPARQTADQIRFALKDVPATDGNRLPPALQSMLDVAEILDRLGSAVSEGETALRTEIARLEAEVERLTAELADRDGAARATELLPKGAPDSPFLSAYAKGAGEAAWKLTVSIGSVATLTSVAYFLGQDHPLIKELTQTVCKLPK
ncbi:leucine-rich repeat domain-containing protein [Jannaschia aquimarina]|uniref:InlA protein n=1 Tax=Jannaschia aquimarina TaxID=935700 RepID=A0A0D1CNF5_9RHOB|nr:leucine-rich repeat domain-containing protein [Jannaschia aquimarina]KIT16267.1 Internalin-A precursor [Jannaschia aquimarina]SNT14927.1 hypothetical protein SAMN05421775_106205 [Jannaschia aquimarina]